MIYVDAGDIDMRYPDKVFRVLWRLSDAGSYLYSEGSDKALGAILWKLQTKKEEW